MSTTSVTQQPPVPEDSPDAEKAAAIAQESPEGVPAHPEAGPRQIGLFLTTIVVGLFVVALVLAVATTPFAGVAVGALALLIFLCNPAVWAAALRAKERHEIEQRDRRDESDEGRRE